MKIRIRYDSHSATIDVPEEDFTVMIRLDYEDRLSRATDPSSIKPRSPQEIMDERFNRPDYNNWHRHWRYTDDRARPRRADGRAGFIPCELENDGGPYHFSMEMFPDTAGAEAQMKETSYRDTCEAIRRAVKPSYAEMVIAIHLNGMKITEYASQIGDKPDNVMHRLRYAEKKLKNLWKKHLV